MNIHVMGFKKAKVTNNLSKCDTQIRSYLLDSFGHAVKNILALKYIETSFPDDDWFCTSK